MSLDDWKSPPINLTLSYGEVHVWRAALDVLPTYLQSLERVLCAQEVHRAQRFRFERDRRRYVAARSTLRILLGRYLRSDPAGVRLQYGEQGKPALAIQAGEEHLCFNVSHSGDLALFAFTRAQEVGVDLEQVRSIPQMEEIAKRYFSVREYAALHKVDLGQRPAAFYRCWTRKEAYSKARGEGLALPLDSLNASLLGAHPLLSEDGGELDRWSLVALEPAPGYVGALAVEGKVLSFRCWYVPRPFREPLVRRRVSSPHTDLLHR